MIYHYRGAVVRITDGDTLVVDVDLGFEVTKRTKVRLYGIDAPESRTRDLAEKAAGKAAKGFLEGLLPVGCEVRLESERLDKYGRCLGRVSANGADVSTTILSAGHAVEYHGGKRG